CKQTLNLRISLRHELNHQSTRESAEIIGDQLQRQVVSDRQDAHQCEDQREIGWTPVGQSVTLLVCPSVLAARVRQVQEEWEDRSIAILYALPIVSPHRPGGCAE